MTDKLDKLRDAVRHKRDLEFQINDLENRLSEHKQRRYTLEHETLPALFNQARVTSLALEPEGNLPAYKAVLAPYYKAVINTDWPLDKQMKAFKLLESLHLGDLIKTIVEIHFNRGEHKATKKFLAAIKKLVRPDQINQKQGVPWATLTAAIRYHYEHGGQFSDDELATLGATVGFVVTLKEQKHGP
jgi:hypothetical protein